MPARPASARGSVGSGLASVMATVRESRLSTLLSAARSPAPWYWFLTVCCSDHTTSSASSACPFEKRSPERIVNV